MTDFAAEFRRKTEEHIAEYGWSAIGVFPTEGNPGLWLTYTVGRAPDRVEFVVVGLDNRVAHAVLAAAVARFEESDPEVGVRYDQVLVAHDVIFRECDDARGYAFGAFQWCDEAIVLQLLYPDEMNRFPGDDGFTMIGEVLL